MTKYPQGHVRQRKDGSWEGQYNYQKRKRSIYGKSEIEVRTRLSRIMTSIREGNYFHPNEYTVSSWMLEWLETYAKNFLRPSTSVNYELIIRRHIIPALGGIFFKNVSVDTLQSFFNSKITGGRRDHKSGGLSPKTLKNIKHILNVAFSQAYYSRIIAFNPVEGVKLPVPEYQEQRVLNANEKETLFQTALSNQTTIAKGIIILLNCGLRKGELLGLRWDNVNFEENFMRINCTLSRLPYFKVTSATQDFIRVDTYESKSVKTGVYLGPVKTKKANRIIYLPKSVRKALLELRDIQDIYRDEFIGDTFNPLGFVLCTKSGRSMEPKTFEDGFKEIVHEAKIKEINIHATRHSFATEALQKSTGLITISEILGHAKPSTTLDMYGHTFDSRKKTLMSMFN